jgi:CBS domain-containing protein
MEENLKPLEELFKKIQKENKDCVTSPKSMIELFGVRRRGWRVVEVINSLLEQYELFTEPAFGNTWIYSEIIIKPKPKLHAKKPNSEVSEDFDPVPRVSRLRAATYVQSAEKNEGVGLIFVSRDATIQTAVHLMMAHDFSQLPILSNNGREPEGIISWRSIGKASAMGENCKTVMDCREPVQTIDETTPLFEAARIILREEVVLVRSKSKNNLITGIITATDLVEQFISLAEPFLIIEQIENHLRKLLSGKFTKEQIAKVIDPNDGGKEIDRLEDLNFGGYVRLIENESHFNKLELNLERKLLIQQLNKVREIRNDVMHFDPEGIDPSELDYLRNTANFLASINISVKKRQVAAK